LIDIAADIPQQLRALVYCAQFKINHLPINRHLEQIRPQICDIRLCLPPQDHLLFFLRNPETDVDIAL
jgi:hypothetical protein